MKYISSGLYPPLLLDACSVQPEPDGTSAQILAAHRDHLIDHPEAIDAYLDGPGSSLSTSDRDIISAWRQHFVKGRFFVMGHTKKHSIHLQASDRAYGVVGPSTGLDEATNFQVPVMIETVILPFKGRTIFCGLVRTWRVQFGPGYRRSLQDDYHRARAAHGIILTLPLPTISSPTGSELMHSYMKTERDRALHDVEIGALLKREPGLTAQYHQEIGRLMSASVQETAPFAGP